MNHEVLHPVTELNADCFRDFSSCFIEMINKNLMGLTLPVTKQHLNNLLQTEVLTEF